jgi:ActR/RegA family two-component response regulator
LKALTCRSNPQQPVHNPRTMRVLIADRNAWLLESISRTFGHQFSIQTASTAEHCGDLLRQGAFDLAIICEKLADGPGLQLLGQIARSSPDTLRIFAARRSRLQLLKGRLGPFGLFRTLAYPIDAQKLQSALVRSRARLEIDPPAAPHGGASTPGPAAVRPIVKRISLVSADALLSNNVPMTIASMRRIRPSESSRVPQPAPVARQASGISSGVRSVQSAAPPRLPLQSGAFERALARRKTARREARPIHRPQLADPSPKRSMALLGATTVAVFLVASVTLNRFDAAAEPSSSARATHTSSIGEQPVISTPPQDSTPAGPTPSFSPARGVAQRAEPKPDSAGPDVEELDPQMAASSTPIADPSSFGSEAYEPIYSN